MATNLLSAESANGLVLVGPTTVRPRSPQLICKHGIHMAWMEQPRHQPPCNLSTDVNCAEVDDARGRKPSQETTGVRRPRSKLETEYSKETRVAQSRNRENPNVGRFLTWKYKSKRRVWHPRRDVGFKSSPSYQSGRSLVCFWP